MSHLSIHIVISYIGVGDVYVIYWGGGSLVVDAYDQCVVVMYGFFWT
jgi:hypothetical protein